MLERVGGRGREREARRPPLSQEASLAARGWDRASLGGETIPGEGNGSVPLLPLRLAEPCGLCAPRAQVTGASSSLPGSPL